MSEPTITMEQLNEILAAVQARGGGRKRKAGGFKRSKATPEESELRRKANDEECFRKFTALGYKDVRPRINVLTYGKWQEKGRQVRKDEKGVSVGPFNLFHEDQTDPIVAVKAVEAPIVEGLEKVKEAVQAATASWTDWNS